MAVIRIRGNAAPARGAAPADEAFTRCRSPPTSHAQRLHSTPDGDKLPPLDPGESASRVSVSADARVSVVRSPMSIPLTLRMAPLP
jgi:hypothetical protein